MAAKIISKTDLEKNAIVMTEDLSRVFHQRGVFPSLGGDNPLVVHAVRIYLRNTKEELQVSYYASLRKENRPIEERLWHSEFARVASVGDELTIDFEGDGFVAEVRPPPRTRGGLAGSPDS